MPRTRSSTTPGTCASVRSTDAYIAVIEAAADADTRMMTGFDTKPTVTPASGWRGAASIAERRVLIDDH